MSLLSMLSQAIHKINEKVKFELINKGEDTFRLLITPISGAIEKSAGNREKQLRAALSIPFRIDGSIKEIESSLNQRFNEYLTVRQPGVDELALLQAAITKAVNTDDNSTSKNTVPTAKKENSEKPPVATDPVNDNADNNVIEVGTSAVHYEDSL